MADRTVRLHRVLKAKSERIYRAFLDPEAVVKWLPPHGFHVQGGPVGRASRGEVPDVVQELHDRQQSFVRRGVSRELVPSKLIRHTDKFDDPNMPGVMETTVSLREVSVGTELNIEQKGIPEQIPLEACYLGWQESLELDPISWSPRSRRGDGARDTATRSAVQEVGERGRCGSKRASP